jgi:hypothetical protein
MELGGLATGPRSAAVGFGLQIDERGLSVDLASSRKSLADAEPERGPFDFGLLRFHDAVFLLSRSPLLSGGWSWTVYEPLVVGDTVLREHGEGMHVTIRIASCDGVGPAAVVRTSLSPTFAALLELLASDAAGCGCEIPRKALLEQAMQKWPTAADMADDALLVERAGIPWDCVVEHSFRTPLEEAKLLAAGRA